MPPADVAAADALAAPARARRRLRRRPRARRARRGGRRRPDRGPARRGEAGSPDRLPRSATSCSTASEAAAALGLDPARRTALVNLGQGGEVDGAVAALAARPDRDPGPPGGGAAVEHRAGPRGSRRRRPRSTSTFPMSRYFRAFDIAVAAAGYNAFHELIAFAVPTLFVPMPRNTDDQAARARWAAEPRRRAGRRAAPIDPALEDAARRARRPATVGSPRSAAVRRAFPGNGAARRGDDARRRCSPGERPAPAVRDRGRFNRWLRLSSHRRRPVAAARRRDRRPRPAPSSRAPSARTSRSSRSGVADDELDRAARRRRSGSIPPERVLVLTDSLAFGDLRRLGVGFELLPPLARRRARGRHRRSTTCAARVRLLLERPPAAPGRLDRRSRRGAARPRPDAIPTAARSDDARAACGTLGGAYGGSGPD